MSREGQAKQAYTRKFRATELRLSAITCLISDPRL